MSPHISVSNRFSQLAEHQDETNSTDLKRNHGISKKVLILGNSHVRQIKTDRFLQNCMVRKFISHSMQEMEDKLDELDTDYDCILLHVFSNDIRNYTSEVFMKKFEIFCQKLQAQCPFAKLLISLPFLSVKDIETNQKILQCNVMIHFVFLNSTNVKIFENSVFYNRGQAVRKFFNYDGLHLSREGTSLFVSNIKYWLREVLKIEREYSQTFSDEQIPPSPHRYGYDPRYRPNTDFRDTYASDRTQPMPFPNNQRHYYNYESGWPTPYYR